MFDVKEGDGITSFVTEGRKHTAVPFLHLEKVAADLTSTFPCGVDSNWSRFCVNTEGSQQSGKFSDEGFEYIL